MYRPILRATTSRLLIPKNRSVVGVVAVSTRTFSDRLMGYSPMAPGVPVDQTSASKEIPTAKDVTTSGGVWAPTSAKRDKMSELAGGLKPEQLSLDEVAKPEEMLDLQLADGLKVLSKFVDTAPATDSVDVEIVQEWKERATAIAQREDDGETLVLRQGTWEDWLRQVSSKVDQLLEAQGKDEMAGVLSQVRNWMDPVDIPKAYEELVPASVTESEDEHDVFDQATRRLRLLLTKHAAEALMSEWKTLTTVSDHDVDRAAVKGVAMDRRRTTLPVAPALAVLESFLTGTAADRVDALWNLVDLDQDGRVDEAETNVICNLAIQPVQKALASVLLETLEARPVRLLDDDDSSNTKYPATWRQRRTEKRVKRKLQNMFKRTCQLHFRDEVEMDHRLRCIYAWANKEDQDNKIASVMVEGGGEGAWNTGRQRYVELPPKISLEEFREVQREHFGHLDRVGQEYWSSFREDLLVDQGKGRQRAELIRDCTTFLVVVSVSDYIILSL